jgi:hypothetical protein
MRWLVVCLAACTRPVPPPLPAGHYDPPSAWLCRPDLPDDPCRRELATTVIGFDAARTVVPAAPRATPPIDCFYVYPTVDLGLAAANHDRFTDLSAITKTTRAQVARFSQLCALYVPLYRQVTIGTYLKGGDRLAHGLDLAYSDVAAAFRTYLAAHPGRPIVLIGHSQGAEMVTRLLAQFFDRDDAMRARLVMALPIGGHITVPFGRLVGGTFAHLPLCSAVGETRCVIAYRSYRAGGVPDEPNPALAPGQQEACVNPGNLADPAAPAALDAVFTKGSVAHAHGITTTFVGFPAAYVGRCAGSITGAQGLEIDDTEGPRPPPLDLRSAFLGTGLGTHVLDLQIAQDDLIELVRRAAIAFH